MKISRFILLALGGCLIAGGAWGRPVDLSAPSSQVGAAGLNGDLQVWREVDGVGLDMGKGSYLPLRFKFSSAADTGGMMGPGFYCPMFEAKNVLVRERMMRAFLPCGKGLYLRRDTIDATKFQSVDQQWTGLLDGDDFVIWRDDGWKLTYRQGRLSSIQTDKNHTFDWSYNDRGVATGVSGDNQPLIGVETDVNGKLSAFSYGGKRYPVDFADRPSMEVVNGQTLVGKLVSAVSAFHYPDGKTETFKVTLAPPDLTPTLDFTNAEKLETVYTWDATNGHIASEKGPDGNWTYKVGDVADQYGVPAISRTNDKGQTEGMALDNKTGTYTATNLDGSTTVTRTFKTPGPLFGKVHKVEKVVNGQSTTLYQASYDEAGRLVREINDQGIVTEHRIDNSGKSINKFEISKDPKLASSLNTEATELMRKIAEAKLPSKRDDAIENLAFFYIYKELDTEKALALLSKVANRLVLFNVRMHAIVGDPNLNKAGQAMKLQQLIPDFPEQKDTLNEMITRKENESKIYDKQ